MNNVETFGLDRKLYITKIIQLRHMFNDAYKEGLYKVCEEEIIYVYAEKWDPTEPTEKLELFKGNPFGLYLENNMDKNETFKKIWKTVKTNVKNSWLEKLTKDEKQWLKTVLYDEFCVSVIH